MYVCGLSSKTFSPSLHHSPTRASQSFFLTVTSFPPAMRSMIRNPRLWGVCSYFFPGLPRPTTSFTNQFLKPSTADRSLRFRGTLGFRLTLCRCHHHTLHRRCCRCRSFLDGWRYHRNQRQVRLENRRYTL